MIFDIFKSMILLEIQREQLEQEKEALNQQLYKAVEDELGKAGKDAKLIDYLTDEIMDIREKLLGYTAREEQLEEVAKEIEELRKNLKPIKIKRVMI